MDLQGHSEVVCYSAIDLVGTKDLKKGFAGRASKSKSKSIAFKSKSESVESKSKSKSSKNGLKSGLESKSGLEYYKSAVDISDVLQDSDKLVEFLIFSGHLSPSQLPYIGSA